MKIIQKFLLLAFVFNIFSCEASEYKKERMKSQKASAARERLNSSESSNSSNF